MNAPAAPARIAWIDTAKGLGMIAVAAGHIWWRPGPAHAIIYSFHMPMFFLLAGYVFKPKPMGDFVAKQLTGIALPYLSFLLLLWAFDCWWESHQGHRPALAGWQGLKKIAYGGTALFGPFTVFWFAPCLLFARLLQNLVAQKWSDPLAWPWVAVALVSLGFGMTARRMFGDEVPRLVRRLPADLSTARYYDEHAESYAEATRALPLHPAFVPFVARLDKGAAVLDLGCGAGRDLRALSLAGLHAVGLDASQPLVELAAEYSGCPVTLGDVRSIPFENGAFAGVWASASLVHLQRDEILASLREVSRVLLSGGYFFSSIKTGNGEGLDSSGRWFTYFQPEAWLALIREAGFKLVDSNITRQKAGTLEKGVSVDWFDCTAQKG